MGHAYIVVLFLVLATGLNFGCETFTKEYHEKHGGSYVFIQPLTPSGAFDLGRYNGHWMNRAYSKARGTYYYDATYLRYFSNFSEVAVWYENETGHKSRIFDMGSEHPPFAVQYI